MAIRITQATLSVLVVPDRTETDIQVSSMFNETLVNAPPTGQVILHGVETLGEVRSNNAIVPEFGTEAVYDVHTKPFRHASDIGEHYKYHLPWPASEGSSPVAGDKGYELKRLTKETDFIEHTSNIDLHNARPSTEYYYWISGSILPQSGILAIPNFNGYGKKIDAVYLRANTAPTGCPIIVDINTLDNSENPTSIFASGSEVKILNGETRGYSKTFQSDFWPKDSYLSVDVDVSGSVIPGSDLTVTIVAH